jgi:adenosylcobinamide kinase/adenosylcobinamide-phosphate guanylyltransferase
VIVDRQLVLILGGARSGKSAYAERLAAERAGTAGEVLYVATAQALDAEMAERIARHRAGRPAGWRTLEEPLDIGPAIAAARSSAAIVLVDCVTLWLSNLLLSTPHDETQVPNPDEAESRARAAVEQLLATHRAGAATTILVSNEVGMGLVPPYPLGRLYRDLLGRVNIWLAAAADEVILLVAGLPLRLKPAPGA